MCYFANVLLYNILRFVKVLILAHGKKYFHRVDRFTILLGVCAHKYRYLSHVCLDLVFCVCHC